MRRPLNLVVEVRNAIKPKESCQSMLDSWTPDTIDRYRHAKQATTWAVLEVKTLIWGEFGKAMQKDYRVASKKFWQAVRGLRKHK